MLKSSESVAALLVDYVTCAIYLHGTGNTFSREFYALHKQLTASTPQPRTHAPYKSILAIVVHPQAYGAQLVRNI